MIKKFTILFILFCLFIPFSAVEGEINTDQPSPVTMCPEMLDASCVLISDLDSGKKIYEQNSEIPYHIASLTKIMTAILILERADLNTIVKVPKSVRQINTWKLGLRWGQKISIRNLLYAILMESRNDAAYVAAVTIAGSEKEFVRWMNAKAKKLSADETIFRNSHGLDIGGGNISTANDLEKITRYALKKKNFLHVINKKEHDIYWSGTRPHHRKLKNVNKLLFNCEGVEGVKTGYTKQAGKCIIVKCFRQDKNLLFIILNATNLWNIAPPILDFGFNSINQ